MIVYVKFDLAWFRPSYSTGPSICTYMKKHGSNDGSHLRMRIKGVAIVVRSGQYRDGRRTEQWADEE